jgi:Domain of unknown function (DUF4421)
MVCKQLVLQLQKNSFLVFVSCFLCCLQLQAQQLHDHDSTYYQSFPRYVTGRFFFSQKFTGVALQKNAYSNNFRYQPNTSVNIGIGVSYKILTINLGYGLSFLRSDLLKGKTKYLDLHSNIYPRKWTIDLFGQFYKGYFLSPKGLAASDPQSYYTRPDLRINLMGVAAYHLLNSSQFSYRAAFLQNEKQKKSAGTFLAGAELYYGIITADSSLVPGAISGLPGQSGVRSVRFIKIGPGAGYAYTFVIEKDFFLTGSLTGNLSLDYSRQNGGAGNKDKFSVSAGYIYRLVAGYDKNNWNINFSLIGNQLSIKASDDNDKYFIGVGTYHLTLAKRIKPGRKLKKNLRPLDQLLPQKL